MKQYYDLKSFPALQELALNWEIIRDEFNKLDVPVMGIDRVDKEHSQVSDEVMTRVRMGEKYGWLLGWGKQGSNEDWLQYGLAAFGSILDFAREDMPKTCKLLEQVNGIHVCALAKMKGDSFLPVHSHPELAENGMLQFHITLDAICDGAHSSFLNVDGKFSQNINGKAIVFDGSLNHYAFNASRKDRTILYMEFDKKLVLNS